MDNKEGMEIACSMRECLGTFLKGKMDEGLRTLNAHETGMVVDMYKDLAEAEEKLAKKEYYLKVTEAMEDKDDKTAKYYTTAIPYTRYPATEYDNVNGMTRAGNVPNMNRNDNMNNSRYDMAKRTYMEMKEMHPEDTDHVMTLVTDITDDLSKMMRESKMKPEEKNKFKNKMTSWLNTL